MAKRTRVNRKPVHYWTKAERQLIVDNINQTPKWLKKNLFSSDRSISPKSLEMQVLYLKNGTYTVEGTKDRVIKTASAPVRGPRGPYNKRKKLAPARIPSQNNGNGVSLKSEFGMDTAFAKFQQTKKSFQEFQQKAVAFFKDSPFSKERKEEILNSLMEQSVKEINNKQVELSRELV